jgi:hypothetical protein
MKRNLSITSADGKGGAFPERDGRTKKDMYWGFCWEREGVFRGGLNSRESLFFFL